LNKPNLPYFFSFQNKHIAHKKFSIPLLFSLTLTQPSSLSLSIYLRFFFISPPFSLTQFLPKPWLLLLSFSTKASLMSHDLQSLSSIYQTLIALPPLWTQITAAEKYIRHTDPRTSCRLRNYRRKNKWPL